MLSTDDMCIFKGLLNATEDSLSLEILYVGSVENVLSMLGKHSR